MRCTGFERLRPATALRDLRGPRQWAALEHPLKTDTGTSRLSVSTTNVIELLLDAGADINDPYRHWSDKSRAESPLYLALTSNVEVAKFLLTRGALCDTQCLDFIDGNLGIGRGMAELQEIAKCRVGSIIPVQSPCWVVQMLDARLALDNEALTLWIPLNYN
jgi:hypothetical protein